MQVWSLPICVQLLETTLLRNAFESPSLTTEGLSVVLFHFRRPKYQRQASFSTLSTKYPYTRPFARAPDLRNGNALAAAYNIYFFCGLLQPQVLKLQIDVNTANKSSSPCIPCSSLLAYIHTTAASFCCPRCVFFLVVTVCIAVCDAERGCWYKSPISLISLI